MFRRGYRYISAEYTNVSIYSNYNAPNFHDNKNNLDILLKDQKHVKYFVTYFHLHIAWVKITSVNLKNHF